MLKITWAPCWVHYYSLSPSGLFLILTLIPHHPFIPHPAHWPCYPTAFTEPGLELPCCQTQAAHPLRSVTPSDWLPGSCPPSWFLGSHSACVSPLPSQTLFAAVPMFPWSSPITLVPAPQQACTCELALLWVTTQRLPLTSQP